MALPAAEGSLRSLFSPCVSKNTTESTEETVAWVLRFIRTANGVLWEKFAYGHPLQSPRLLIPPPCPG